LLKAEKEMLNSPGAKSKLTSIDKNRNAFRYPRTFKFDPRAPLEKLESPLTNFPSLIRNFIAKTVMVDYEPSMKALTWNLHPKTKLRNKDSPTLHNLPI
jgi:hypothetical protein